MNQEEAKLLESIRSEGENDPYWNACMGYFHVMANSSVFTDYEYAKRWLVLAPETADAQKLITMDFDNLVVKEATIVG